MTSAVPNLTTLSSQCPLLPDTRRQEREREMHYCRPDGNIPHDQTNQSPWWDAGAPQPCSNTPFHSLSAANTWSPINGPLRTRASPLPHRFMADDFIITHPSLSPFSSSCSPPWRRSVMSYLITLSFTHPPPISPRRLMTPLKLTHAASRVRETVACGQSRCCASRMRWKNRRAGRTFMSQDGYHII